MIKDEEMQRSQSSKWNRIFDEIIEKQSDDDFIIESYNSREGDPNSIPHKPQTNMRMPDMSKKNLYNVIKGLVKDEHTCRKLIKELEMDADFLSTLNDPPRYFDTDTIDDIRAIKILKAKFVRIPMLAAYRKWAQNGKINDYLGLVSLLVKFFFKIRVVRQLHPGQIKKIVQNITRQINRGDSFENVLSSIRHEDNHEEFVNDFKKRFAVNPSTDAAKYVLQQITIHLGTEYDDVKPIDGLTLEHILPKNHEKWNTVDFLGDDQDADIEEFKSRLGNMTLLQKNMNVNVQNDPFQLKKARRHPNTGKSIGYEGSQLHINKQTVCNYDRWTAETIKLREEEFTKYARKIWRL